LIAVNRHFDGPEQLTTRDVEGNDPGVLWVEPRPDLDHITAVVDFRDHVLLKDMLEADLMVVPLTNNATVGYTRS
jgi:hypothetical protein